MDKSNLDINSALEAAWLKLLDIFPFNNYIRNPRKVGYFFMVKKVAERSARNANVLDFGSGPCDKIALFLLVGMNVTAIDDMQDVWHKIEDNKKKILNFANTVGINYIVSNNLKNLSLPKEHFDVLMSHDVLEHLHSSPRVLLNNLLQYVKPNGIMVITVPNAANLRKRIHLLLGKTNYNKYNYYYWYP